MFGDDTSLAMKLIVSLVIVLALIGFAVLILRRFGMGKLGGFTSQGRQPRLAVMDVAHLDQRRKLVIVRRDTTEHLIMIGGPNDVVVEQGIIRGQPVGSDLKPPKAPQPRITPTFSAPEKQEAPATGEDPSSLPHIEPPTR